MSVAALLFLLCSPCGVPATETQTAEVDPTEFFVGEWRYRGTGDGLVIAVLANGQWQIGDQVVHNMTTKGGRLSFIHDVDGEKWTSSYIPHPTDRNKLFAVCGRINTDPRFHSVECWTAAEDRAHRARHASSQIVSSGTWQVWLTSHPMEYRVSHNTSGPPNVELGDVWSTSGVTRQHRVEKGILKFIHVLVDEEATNLNVSLIPDPTNRNRLFVEWIRGRDATKTVLIATKSRK